jgi:ubiquinone/menaquinone biosynthesis C-methylase UbiE
VIKRKPQEHGVFEDVEVVKRYDKEARGRIWGVSRGFVIAARKWGITTGTILDVGTGTGLLAIEFAKEIPDVEVIGLDLSEVALDVARDHAQMSDMSLRVSFERGDVEDMPFEDGIFDLVISSNTLHLIKHPIRTFNETQRVLKPEGKFFISDFRRSWLGLFSQHIRAAYSPNEVRDLLGQSQLHNWAVKDYLFWLSILSKD